MSDSSGASVTHAINGGREAPCQESKLISAVLTFHARLSTLLQFSSSSSPLLCYFHGCVVLGRLSP